MKLKNGDILTAYETLQRISNNDHTKRLRYMSLSLIFIVL